MAEREQQPFPRPCPQPTSDGWASDDAVVAALRAMEAVVDVFGREEHRPGPVSVEMLASVANARALLAALPASDPTWTEAAGEWLDDAHNEASFLKFLPPVPRPHDNDWHVIEAVSDSIDAMDNLDMAIDACNYRGEPYTPEIIEQLATVRRWLNHVPKQWSAWVADANAWLDAADAGGRST